MDIYRNTRPTVELRLSYREAGIIKAALTKYALEPSIADSIADDAARMANDMREKAGA